MTVNRSDDARFLKGRISFPVYFASAEMVDSLTDEEAGRIFKAVIQYAKDQKPPDFKKDRLLSTVFINFRKFEDDSRVKYLETCRKNSANGKKRKTGTKQSEDDRAGEEAEPNTVEDIIQAEGLPFR